MKTSKRAKPKPSVAIVGPGRLGTALAISLHRQGYPIRHIVGHSKSKRPAAVRALAKRCKAEYVVLGSTALNADLVWITVPDDAIAGVAEQLANLQEWRGAIVFHSSGALSTDELAPLSEKGALVASLHPMMTFAPGKAPNWRGVAFTFEGDEEALPAARGIVEDLGGELFRIEKGNKVLYHAFASFASPLLTAVMAATELVAKEAGLEAREAKRIMAPLVFQTLNNYIATSAAEAFTGPIARGDVATIRKHVLHLERVPEARRAYIALANAALDLLPAENRAEIRNALQEERQRKGEPKPNTRKAIRTRS